MFLAAIFSFKSVQAGSSLCELEKRTMRSIMGYRILATVSIWLVFPPVLMLHMAIDVGVGRNSSCRGCRNLCSLRAPFTARGCSFIFFFVILLRTAPTRICHCPDHIVANQSHVRLFFPRAHLNKLIENMGRPSMGEKCSECAQAQSSKLWSHL